MSEKHCTDSGHEGLNPLPESEFYTKPKYACKGCVRRRARKQMNIFRGQLKDFGLPHDATAAELQAARAEFAVPRWPRTQETKPEPEPKLVFVDRKPMFTGMVRQSRSQKFSWKVA